jgi:3-hydroxyacyl-CoA dehydrogenase/enoyl-CoA hydratase/3-hydroxybutyryl-CoA epimerase
MIGTFWFQLNEINAGLAASRAPYVTRKVGVLGAGMMGAGHRLRQRLAGRGGAQGHQPAAAEKGKAHSAALLDKKVAAGNERRAARSVLARIQPRSDADLAGCDLIIEAVFEDRELKAKVPAAAQNVVGPTR